MGDSEIVRRVLNAYGLAPESIAPGGGTAGSTWRVETKDGTYFVRRRGVRTSAPERIAFDHGLRRHLAEQNFPTVAPLATRDGKTWFATETGVFEVYPFVEGEAFSPTLLPRTRRSTAATLARLHALAATYEGVCEKRVPQYTTYPVTIAPRRRFDDPEAQLEAIDFLIEAYGVSADRDALARARERAAWAGEAYAAWYEGLPRGVVHADYNCFNLLFSPSGEVAGVFDFDWAWREVRLLDIAQGMFFFGTHREGDFDPGSIWSLTRCPRFDGETMREFVLAYDAEAPLAESEWHALPVAMLARWVSWRIEGAMKIPEARRVEFFLYGFFKPFDWYDRTRGALRQG